MLIQQRTKARVLGAAMILALMFVCSIAASAAITSSSTSVQFPNQTVGTMSAPMPVTITNTATNSVVVESAVISDAQFSFSGSSFPVTLSAGQSFTGAVTFTPSAAKAYSATLKFTRRGGGSLLSVSLRGTGTAVIAPSQTLVASLSALSFSATAGGVAPATQSLTIGENPAGALPFTVSADQAWITLSAASGTTSSAIQVGVNISGLAAGSYSGHVIVSAAGVTNSPVSIPVTLVVSAAQGSSLLSLQSLVPFAAQAGGAVPAAQTLTIVASPAAALPVTTTVDQPWISVVGGTATTKAIMQVSVNATGLAAGTYNGHVIVSSPGAPNSPLSIPVTMVISGAASTLTAAPSTLSFSAQVGAVAPATQSLTIGASPAAALPFTVSADQAWMTLSAASGTTSGAIQVGANISGLAAGSYTGHVIVSTAGVANSPVSIPVTLTVAAAPVKSLTVSSSALAFSATAAGVAPATQSLTIGENPAGALPFTVSADQAWMTLSADGGTTSAALQVGVNISGLAAGSYSGHVIVSAAGVTNSPVSIPVTLVVSAAQGSSLLSLQSLVPFAAQAGGAVPAAQTLTIVASPAAALPVTTTVDQPWISVVGGTATTKAIMQVSANTTGLAAGSYSGHVIVSSPGAPNSPLSIPVTMVVGAAQPSSLSVSPTSVAFGNVNVGNNNTKSVTITNSGTGTVTISSVSAAGAGISVNGVATPMPLTAGQSTVLSIVFAPTAVGAVNGTVSVVSDATNTPGVITATGAGVQPQLSASPSALNFGSVAVGANGTQTITLSNTGSAAVTVSQAVASGSGYTMSGLALPMTLAAGASTSFSVQFAPTVAGSDSGSVTVTSNTPNSPTMVALNGTATAPVAHSASLTWVASTSPTVVGYNIYRGSVSGGPYSMLNSTPNAAMSYTDGTVLGGQTYYYVVTAVDANGMESVMSNEVAVIIP